MPAEEIRIGRYIVSRPPELDEDSVWIQTEQERDKGDGTEAPVDLLEAAIRDVLDTWGLA